MSDPVKAYTQLFGITKRLVKEYGDLLNAHYNPPYRYIGSYGNGLRQVCNDGWTLISAEGGPNSSYGTTYESAQNVNARSVYGKMGVLQWTPALYNQYPDHITAPSPYDPAANSWVGPPGSLWAAAISLVDRTAGLTNVGEGSLDTFGIHQGFNSVWFSQRVAELIELNKILVDYTRIDLKFNGGSPWNSIRPIYIAPCMILEITSSSAGANNVNGSLIMDGQASNSNAPNNYTPHNWKIIFPSSIYQSVTGYTGTSSSSFSPFIRDVVYTTYSESNNSGGITFSLRNENGAPVVLGTGSILDHAIVIYTGPPSIQAVIDYSF